MPEQRFVLIEVTRLADRYFLQYISDGGAERLRELSESDHDLIIRWRAADQITPRVLRGEITVDQVVLPWQRSIVAAQVAMNPGARQNEIQRGQGIEAREHPNPPHQWRFAGIFAGVPTYNTASKDFEPHNISVEPTVVLVWTPTMDNGEDLLRSEHAVQRDGFGKITLVPDPSGFQVIAGELIWP